MSNDTKPREWQMQFDTRSVWWMVFDGPMGEVDEEITVVEKLPDHITISRSEFIASYREAFGICPDQEPDRSLEMLLFGPRKICGECGQEVPPASHDSKP